MQVLALNSSPRTDKESCTFFMLNALVEGMREAGADVEVINLRSKKINHCIGCFSRWTKTPGQCVHKDDMTQEIFPKWQACDMAVYASPLYYHTVNAMMSKFMERTLPAIYPFFEKDENGNTFHPIRYRIPPLVLLSVCGFPEASEFNAMLEFFERTQHQNITPLGAICRAGASLLTVPALKNKASDVLQATRQAGQELIKEKKISPETLARISQPIGSPESFRKMGNLFWKTCIAERVTPKEFDEKKMVPRPTNLEEFLFVFPFGLNAGAVTDSKVYLQFHFSGEVNDACHFIIAKGKVEACPGVCEKPDLTIETPFSVWMDIMTRKSDGAKMLMEGKYQVRGDASLMLTLFQTGNQHV